MHDIIKQFLPKVDVISIQKLKGGIINKTFLIETKDSKKYILQQINDVVFPNISSLMKNLEIITEHLHQKSIKQNAIFPFYIFKYYKIESGLNYYKHSDKTYWRLSDYIPHANKVDKQNLKIVSEAGKLFGYFIQQLKDVDLNKIHDVIPAFHDSEKYYKRFITSAEKDFVGRLSKTKNIYNHFLDYKIIIDDFIKIKNNNKIPFRLVHNDTKLDNILFNNKEQAISVIDLDTCMSGYLMTDFGDAIRSLSNTGKEDDKNLENVSFDFALYKSFADGFLKSVSSFILQEEKEHLAFFALLLTYEQALRFYTDYLNGDSYYQIDYSEHNLQRTKAQLKLFDEMYANYEKMKSYLVL